jgi:hypothetical protein
MWRIISLFCFLIPPDDRKRKMSRFGEEDLSDAIGKEIIVLDASSSVSLFSSSVD